MSKFLKPERLFVEPNSPNGQRKWNHWYRTFMNYMDSIEDIAVVQKLNVLINHVDARIYEYISNANTFDEAIRILETVFVKETNEVLARHRLATCKQKSNQSLDEYLQTLQTISEECNFVEVSATRCRDEAIRDAFIAGICSNEIRQQLLEIRQLNLLETFCKARMLDMSYLAPEKLNTVNTCSINDLNSLCSNDARIITSDNGSYTDQEIDFKATNQSFSPTVGNNSTSIEATSDEELHLQPADERFLSLKSNENVDTNYYLLDPSNEYDSSFSDSEDIETLRKIGEEATKHSSWMQPSYVASSTHSAQVPQSHHTTSMQASSPSFYPQQSPQQLYHRHAAPLQTFSPYQDNSISFQPTTHPPKHCMTPINAPPVQPLPQSTQPARRKLITIRDPSTVKDVTDDIMQSGKQPLSSSPSVRSATPGQQPVAVAQAPTDQIVAQFAHQVAVFAAKNTPDKSSTPTSPSSYGPKAFTELKPNTKKYPTEDILPFETQSESTASLIPSTTVLGSQPSEWSIENSSGEDDAVEFEERIVYDRDFLMSLRYHKLSLEKPHGLFVISDYSEIILDRPYPKTIATNRFTPSYMRGGRNNIYDGWKSRYRDVEGSVLTQRGPYGSYYTPLHTRSGKEGIRIETAPFEELAVKIGKMYKDIGKNTVMLGPRGKHSWKSGSSSNMTKTGSGSHGRYRDTDSYTAPQSSTPTMMNRSSALGASAGKDIPYMQRTSGRISSREGSKSGQRGSTGSGSSGGYRESGRMERRGSHDTVNANAKRVTSQENKIARRDLTPVSKGSTDSIPDQKLIMDVAAIEKVYKGIITEYFHIVDIKECYECFIAVNVAPEATFHFVKLALEMSLEKSSTDRSNVAQLLSNFVKRGLIKPEVYLKGALVNMELAVEVELDLPKVWSFVSEQLTPMFYDSGSKIQLRHLEKLAQPLLEFQKADVFVVEILKCLMKQVSVHTALRQWNESGLSWEYFLQTSDHSVINEFLQKHDLKAFYSSTNAAVSTKTSALPTRCNINSHYSEIVKQLEMGKSNKEIIDWLETKSDHVSESTFIRALTTAVCEKSIIQTDHQLEVNKDILKGRCSLLKKFIDKDDEELQAVYALQRLYLELEQPPNVLKLLFDALYDEDVISEQTFFKWEKDNNPAESEGKGVAMLSVNPFFTWLRDANEVESDE